MSDQKLGRLVNQVGVNADGHVSVVWTTQNGQTPEKHSLEDCVDGPYQSFHDAWDALLPHALALVEIGDERWKGARVSQLKANQDPLGGRNYVMTLVKTLEHGGTTINTPMRKERKDESEVGAQYASLPLLVAMQNVFDEAARYAIEGERKKLVIELDLGDARKQAESVEDGSGEDVRQPKPRPRAMRQRQIATQSGE